MREALLEYGTYPIRLEFSFWAGLLAMALLAHLPLVASGSHPLD